MTEEEARERFAAFDREAAESMEAWIEKLGLSEDEAERMRDGHRHFILLNGEPVVVGMYEWAHWFEKSEHRIIGQEDVLSDNGTKYWVSTVFLGRDHSFGRPGPPLLFETMIFELHEPVTLEVMGIERTHDRDEVWMCRYATLQEAELGHLGAIVRAEINMLDDD